MVFNSRAQDNAGTVLKTGGFWRGGGGWGVGGGGTGICAEHFLYNENNLTNCSTQRNSPPIPHNPPPFLHHYITISKPGVQSKSSLSRMGARQTEGGREGGGRGQDRGSKSRPKTELAFILFRCVRACVQERHSAYVGVQTQVHVY